MNSPGLPSRKQRLTAAKNALLVILLSALGTGCHQKQPQSTNEVVDDKHEAQIEERPNRREGPRFDSDQTYPMYIRVIAENPRDDLFGPRLEKWVRERATTAGFTLAPDLNSSRLVLDVRYYSPSPFAETDERNSKMTPSADMNQRTKYSLYYYLRLWDRKHGCLLALNPVCFREEVSRSEAQSEPSAKQPSTQQENPFEEVQLRTGKDDVLTAILWSRSANGMSSSLWGACRPEVGRVQHRVCLDFGPTRLQEFQFGDSGFEAILCETLHKSGIDIAMVPETAELRIQTVWTGRASGIYSLEGMQGVPVHTGRQFTMDLRVFSNDGSGTPLLAIGTYGGTPGHFDMISGDPAVTIWRAQFYQEHQQQLIDTLQKAFRQ